MSSFEWPGSKLVYHTHANFCSLVNSVEDDPEVRITSEMMDDVLLYCLPYAQGAIYTFIPRMCDCSPQVLIVNPRDENGVVFEGKFWWDEDVIKLKDEVEVLIRDVAAEDIDAVLEGFKRLKVKGMTNVYSVCSQHQNQTEM